MGKFYYPKSKQRADRYLVSVEQYKQYHKDGYLIVRGLLGSQEVAELFELAEESRRSSEKPVSKPNANSNDPLKDEFATATRIHMLSRVNAAAERGMLNPRILDVTEALIGPDVYALQSMMFLNPPGKGGQGWHQDSCYIRTHPDTLLGAWVALEEVDEENGCLWVVPGSNHEPVYPPDGIGGGNVHALDSFSDLQAVQNVSNINDEVNTLSKVVAKYPPAIPVRMSAGDVLFFHSHLFHRSYPNRTKERYRRSYVCHYCNARSWVPWDHDEFEGDSGNYRQILARGSTSQPYAEPAFGTEVYLTDEDEVGQSLSMMGMDNGMMMPMGMTKE
ncbi:phytanoyl-CoA dioxygenase family protein [Paenibacillus sp. strain BS8-2]